jgi:hypothetical protein
VASLRSHHSTGRAVTAPAFVVPLPPSLRRLRRQLRRLPAAGMAGLEEIKNEAIDLVRATCFFKLIWFVMSFLAVDSKTNTFLLSIFLLLTRQSASNLR